MQEYKELTMTTITRGLRLRKPSVFFIGLEPRDLCLNTDCSEIVFTNLTCRTTTTTAITHMVMTMNTLTRIPEDIPIMSLCI